MIKKTGRYLSLRSRFLMVMAVILIPMLVLGSIAMVSLYRAVDALDSVLTKAFEEMTPARDIEALLLECRTAVYRHITESDPGATKDFEGIRWRIETLFESARENSDVRSRRPLLDAAYREWTEARGKSADIFATTPGQAGEELHEALAKFSEFIDEAIWNLETIRTQAQGEMNEERHLARSIKMAALFRTALVFALGILAVAASVASLAESVLEPLKMLEEGAEKLGEGDLSYRVKIKANNDIQRLAFAFNRMAAKLEQDQSALEELSTRDGLTGVFNYREFRRRLAHEVERSKRYEHPFSLLMLDMDRFKKINDSYGHQVGDEVLRRTAALLKDELRPNDVISRYGGEEFAIILSETEVSKATFVAERLRKALSGLTLELNGGIRLNVTASIGVAGYPADAATDVELISVADHALYSAKRMGRDRVVRAGVVATVEEEWPPLNS